MATRKGNSKDYWEDRELQESQVFGEIEGIIKREKTVIEKEKKIYSQALAELDKELDDLKKDVGEDAITQAALRKPMTAKDLEQWSIRQQNRLRDLIDEFGDEEGRKIFGMENAETGKQDRANRVVRRQETLRKSIDAIANGAAAKTEKETRKALEKEAEKGVESFQNQLPASLKANARAEFDTVDEGTVTRAAQSIFKAEDFSERIWANRDVLAQDLERSIGLAVTNGWSIPRLAKEFEHNVAVDERSAERIARTEMNRVSNAAELAQYREKGIKFYRFIATEDARTCEICGQIHDQVFSVDDATTGANFPPVHPNCRCRTVISSVDEEGKEDLSWLDDMQSEIDNLQDEFNAMDEEEAEEEPIKPKKKAPKKNAAGLTKDDLFYGAPSLETFKERLEIAVKAQIDAIDNAKTLTEWSEDERKDWEKAHLIFMKNYKDMDQRFEIYNALKLGQPNFDQHDLWQQFYDKAKDDVIRHYQDKRKEEEARNVEESRKNKPVSESLITSKTLVEDGTIQKTVNHADEYRKIIAEREKNKQFDDFINEHVETKGWGENENANVPKLSILKKQYELYSEYLSGNENTKGFEFYYGNPNSDEFNINCHTTFDDTDDDEFYQDAGGATGFNRNDGTPTMILRSNITEYGLLHEIGHAIHSQYLDDDENEDITLSNYVKNMKEKEVSVFMPYGTDRKEKPIEPPKRGFELELVKALTNKTKFKDMDEYQHYADKFAGIITAFHNINAIIYNDTGQGIHYGDNIGELTDNGWKELFANSTTILLSQNKKAISFFYEHYSEIAEYVQQHIDGARIKR